MHTRAPSVLARRTTSTTCPACRQNQIRSGRVRVSPRSVVPTVEAYWRRAWSYATFCPSTTSVRGSNCRQGILSNSAVERTTVRTTSSRSWSTYRRVRSDDPRPIPRSVVHYRHHRLVVHYRHHRLVVDAVEKLLPGVNDLYWEDERTYTHTHTHTFIVGN